MTKKFKAITLQNLCLIMISGFLAACALNKDAGGATDQDRTVADRSQKIRAESAEIIGLYDGNLQTSSGPYSATISLYTIEVDDGLDSAGRTRTKPSLKASFILNDSADNFSELTVSYDHDSGEFTMASSATGTQDKTSTSSTAGTAGRKTVSIRGSVRNNVLSGEVTKEGGIFGNLSLNFKSQKATALSDQDRKDRVFKIYERVVGKYSLTYVTSDLTETDEVNLRVSGTSNPPTLIAECKSSFFGIEIMNVAFDPMTKPATVYISTNPANTAPGRCFFSNFTGTPTTEGLNGIVDIRGKASMPALFKKLNPN